MQAIFAILLLFLSSFAFGQQDSGATQDSDKFDAFESVDFQFAKECKIESRNSRYNSVDGKYVQHNSKCDHEWALKNANSVNSVYEIHTNKKIQKINQADITMEKLKEDGICMEDEGVGQDKKECLARVKRESLQIKIQTRNEIIKNNKQRMELVNDQPTLVNDTDSPNPKMSVLNDFYRYSQKSIKQKNKKNKLVVNPFIPQVVDFGDKGLDKDTLTIKESKGAPIYSGRKKSILGLEQSQNTIEVEGDFENDKVKNAVIKNLKNRGSGFSQRDYEQDSKNKQKKIIEYGKKNNALVNSSNTNASVSALSETMSDVNESLGGTLKEQYENEGSSRSPGSVDSSTQYMSTSIFINKDSMDRPAKEKDYILDEELIRLMNNPNYPD